MRIFMHILLLGTLAGLLGCSAEQSDTIKIAMIDPLTGPTALQGNSSRLTLQTAIDEANAKGVLGDQKLELVPLDNKGSPQESLVALSKAIDQGIRYVTQGAGSHVAHALTDAILKHNQRNPGKEVIFLNNAAIDPPLTNEKCHFWHFRFDANVTMKVDAITTAIRKNNAINKIYLLNQDYSYGQSVAKATVRMLGEKRSDIQIVGNELHPIMKVKDFAPYVAKIKASGANAIYTGNWGSDLSLFVKAVGEAGLDVALYTNYAYLVGTPRSFGPAAINRVKVVMGWHPNIEGYPEEQYYLDYKNKHGEDWVFMPQRLAIDMWAEAIRKAGSAEPKDVAYALEDLRYDAGVGEVWMRPDDHQAIEPLFVATLSDLGGQVKHPADDTEYGWKTDVKIEAKDNILPTTCNMVRP